MPVKSAINLNALMLNEYNKINDIISIEQPVGAAGAIVLKNQSLKIELSKISSLAKSIYIRYVKY